MLYLLWENQSTPLLLDGQQRLTALAAVIRGEPVTVRGRQRPPSSCCSTWSPPDELAVVTEVNEKVSEVFKTDSAAAFLKRAGVSGFDDPCYEKYSQRLAPLRSVRKYVYRRDVLERRLTYNEVTKKPRQATFHRSS
jgi:hypothetical protein